MKKNEGGYLPKGMEIYIKKFYPMLGIDEVSAFIHAPRSKAPDEASDYYYHNTIQNI
jgi:hypothetical protein